MPRPKSAVPTYRLHKASGQAVCYIDRQDVYLGKYGSPESKERFRRLLAENPTAEKRSLVMVAKGDIEVAPLVAAYLKWANGYYGDNRRAVDKIKKIAAPLYLLYGTLPANEFTPKCLVAVRDWIIARGDERKGKDKKPIGGRLCRNYVNDLIDLIRRVWKWGVAEELVSAPIYQALMAVKSIAKGRDERLTEGRKVKPVKTEHVEAVLEHLPPELQVLVQVQELAGMRPDEATIMRKSDLDTSDTVWVYTLAHHKLDWMEDEAKQVLLGPKAQKLLSPLLKERKPDEYLFSPKRAVEWFNARRAEAGKHVITVDAGEHYTDQSYRQVIKRACRLARIPEWTPNQLRHSAATRIEHKHGRVASSLFLHHKNINTTAVYADRNLPLYAELARTEG